MQIDIEIEHHFNSLEFYVTCQTLFGEEVRICGNSIETGNWNPLNGHKLYTDQNLFPIWKSCVPLIIKNNQKILYKACILSVSRCIWETNIPDREIQTQSPSILKFTFNQPNIKVIPKKVTQIQCRQGTFDIIQELESSQKSSNMQFKANYPIQNFFGHDNQSNMDKFRKFSTSQLSSNLFSINGQTSDLIDIEEDQIQSENQKVQIKYERMNSPQLLKTRSIRPFIEPIDNPIKPHPEKLHINISQVKKRKRQNSNSLKRSESGSKSRKQQPQSPYMIHIPGAKKSKSKLNLKSPNKLLRSKQNDSKNDESSTQSKSDRKSNEQNDTDSSTSTVIQYDTEYDYLNNRDLDVVIQEHHRDFNYI